MPRPTPTLTVDVVLFTADPADVLLIRRGWPPFQGRLALPGGLVDPGETPLAAAIRELREETGIRVVTLDPVAVYNRPGRDPRGPYISHAFTALAARTRPRAGDDAAAATWTPLAQARRLAFDHDQILADAARLSGLTR